MTEVCVIEICQPFDMLRNVVSRNCNSCNPIIKTITFTCWRTAAVRWPSRDSAPIRKVGMGTKIIFLLNFTTSFSLTDAESHILFFDIEGLIFELINEEYAALSPNTLEVSIRWICCESVGAFVLNVLWTLGPGTHSTIKHWSTAISRRLEENIR